MTILWVTTMAQVTHYSNVQSLNKHWDSMMTSLAHRLEVAHANHNVQLVAQLEQERAQLAHSVLEHPPSTGWLQTLSQWLTNRFIYPVIEVNQYQNGSDQWWYAFDPRTGQWVYADSEAELRLWIKENYQGR